MKVLILYRSWHGNTARVAEEMAGKIRSMGHEADVRDIRQRLPDLRGTDAVAVGAPTRMGSVTGRARRALGKLKGKGFGGTVAVFDTCGVIPRSPEDREKLLKFFEPGAAGILMRTARGLGLNLYPETVRCEVSGMKGPLTTEALVRASSFAEALVYYLGKRAASG